MIKQDITDSCDQELDFIFRNNQGFYLDMIESVNFSEVESLANDFFKYTDKQLSILKDTYKGLEL